MRASQCLRWRSLERLYQWRNNQMKFEQVCAVSTSTPMDGNHWKSIYLTDLALRKDVLLNHVRNVGGLQARTTLLNWGQGWFQFITTLYLFNLSLCDIIIVAWMSVFLFITNRNPKMVFGLGMGHGLGSGKRMDNPFMIGGTWIDSKHNIKLW
jgi:hypothetical protein